MNNFYLENEMFAAHPEQDTLLEEILYLNGTFLVK